MIIVNLTLATLCIIGKDTRCYRALIGKDTPVGEYKLTQRLTDQPFYGGDVLQFKEDEKNVYAIHRVYLGNPKQKRLQRLESSNEELRRITNGCINVANSVYDELVDCCSNDTLRITR